MKKSTVAVIILNILFFGMISVSGEDHKHELYKIGERIKRAVDAGKITEKEGWAKWHAVQREHGHYQGTKHGDDEVEDLRMVKELEHEIELLELEFELERLEHEHDIQRMEWSHQRERMKRDFDRERREWDMGNLQLDKHRKHMEMQMRLDMPHHGARPVHPYEGPRPNLQRGGPRPAMPHPTRKGPSVEKAEGVKAHPNTKEKSECRKDQEESNCTKEKKRGGKKESRKPGKCSLKGSKSCPDKDNECSEKRKKK